MSVRPQVVVYVKPAHAPSRRVVAMLERLQQDSAFDLQQVEVAKAREFRDQHGAKAPVVTIDGSVAFKGPVSETALRRRLKEVVEGSEPVVVESLDAYESSARVPAGLMAVLLAVVLVGFGYFVWEGVANAAFGRGRLARDLLQVQSRDDGPPAFNLERFDGRKIASDEVFKDRVVFINFWATWCPPCVEEMPSLLRLRAKMNDAPRFEMLAISADEGWAPVREFFDKEPAFDVLLDEEGELAKEYGTTKFPETYVVVDGRLVGYIVGPRDWDTWYAEAYLRALLEHGRAL